MSCPELPTQDFAAAAGACQLLYEEQKIYVIAFREAGRCWLRVSGAMYLQLSDYSTLAQVTVGPSAEPVVFQSAEPVVFFIH
jgi:hypothetical protein